MGWTRANHHAGRTTSRKMKDFAVTITLTTRYGRMTAMKRYPAVLSTLHLGFPMCGYQAEEWVAAFRRQGLISLWPNWGRIMSSGA
jgi:hypothetical protein